MKDYLTPPELQAALALRDLSDPMQGLHALSLLLTDVTAALQRLWGIDAETHRAIPPTTSPVIHATRATSARR